MVSVVAAAIGVQALSALAEPGPGETRNLWNLVPIALACVALALAWRPRAHTAPAILVLFLAQGIAVFTVLGDAPFARIVVAIVAGAFALCVAWIGLGLPLLAWRRGRWPTDAIEYEPHSEGAQDAEALRARREALLALGFKPRLVLGRSEHGVSVTVVVFSHNESDVYASLRRVAVPHAAIATTQVFSRPSESATLSVSDGLVPSPFPPGPDLTFLLFPDADAATLLAHFRRLHPRAQDAVPLSDDALASALKAWMARQERGLVEAGYLSSEERDHARGYTLKGAFCATLRPRWPWYAILRSRFTRDGEAALRKAAASRA